MKKVILTIIGQILLLLVILSLTFIMWVIGLNRILIIILNSIVSSILGYAWTKYVVL